MATELVLIHGLNSTGKVWDRVRALLPGSIRSTAPDCPALDDVDAIAAALIDSLPERFHLAGYSFGGYVALALLANYPERVASLIMVATSAFGDSPARQDFRRQGIAAAEQGGLMDLAMAQFPQAVHSGNVDNAELRKSYAAEVQSYGLEKYRAHQLAAIARPDRNALLAQAPCPVLFITAEEDNVVPLNLQLKSAGQSTDIRLVQVPDTGHLLVLEDPQRIATELALWCQ